MLVLDVIKLDVCILGNFHQEINAGRVIRRRSRFGRISKRENLQFQSKEKCINVLLVSDFI